MGQRQLVSFARALAHNPRFLILDEATSSVDTHTEMMIREALDRLLTGRTAIVIAHRLSTIQHADRILVFHKGRLREQGTHQELLAQRGIYYRLYQLQYKDQEMRVPVAPRLACQRARCPPKISSNAARVSHMPPIELLISAGEASGDMYAARLATALRARADVRLFGMGGPRMREAGVDIVVDYRGRRARRPARGRAQDARPQPRLAPPAGRNAPPQARARHPHRFPRLPSAPLARPEAQGVRNVYFVCPQFWAWRPRRVNLVRRRFERGLCIFPFEVDFYRKHGVPVDWIGHPLVDQVHANADPRRICSAHKLDAAKANRRAAAGQPPRRD